MSKSSGVLLNIFAKAFATDENQKETDRTLLGYLLGGKGTSSSCDSPTRSWLRKPWQTAVRKNKKKRTQ